MMVPARARSRHRNRNRNRILGLTLAGLASSALGCSMVTPFGSVYTIAANGGPSYIAGRATQIFAASDGFIDQARGALEDINIHAITQRNEAGTIVLEGRAPNGKSAHVRLQPEDEGRKMHVFVRFGSFGDEALSRGYLEALGTRLRPLPGDLQETASPSPVSPPLKLKANSAVEPPGSSFQRRLEGGVQSDQPFQ
jgi:hypothetical protein